MFQAEHLTEMLHFVLIDLRQTHHESILNFWCYVFPSKFGNSLLDTIPDMGYILVMLRESYPPERLSMSNFPRFEGA